MRQYILQRALLGAGALFGLSIVVFGMIRLLPGDPAVALAGESGDQQLVEEIRRQYGLDKSVPEQYVIWLSRAVKGDLGDSVFTGESTVGRIAAAAPITLELAFFGFIGAATLAVLFGVLAGWRQDQWPDHVVRVVSVGALSIPDFALGTLIILVLSSRFGWLPPLVYRSPVEDPWYNFLQFIFPVSIIALRYSASGMRLTRSAMVEVLREDYIRTAYAKGIKRQTVLFRHGLRNALIPVITILGAQLGYLLSGSVIIERIFGLPGLGNQLIEAISRRDYPQVQANVLLFGVILITINIAVDLLYGWLDPRIRY